MGMGAARSGCAAPGLVRRRSMRNARRVLVLHAGACVVCLGGMAVWWSCTSPCARTRRSGNWFRLSSSLTRRCSRRAARPVDASRRAAVGGPTAERQVVGRIAWRPRGAPDVRSEISADGGSSAGEHGDHALRRQAARGGRRLARTPVPASRGAQPPPCAECDVHRVLCGAHRPLLGAGTSCGDVGRLRCPRLGVLLLVSAAVATLLTCSRSARGIAGMMTTRPTSACIGRSASRPAAEAQPR